MRPIRMLVADDSSTVQAFFAGIAERSPVPTELVTARTGRECLALLQGGDVDLAFVDVNMPKLSGMEAVGRARFSGRDTFIVLMSARTGEERFEVARQFRVYEYLVKPFLAADVEEILAVHRRVMRRWRTLIVDDSGTIRRVIRRVLARSIFRLSIDEASDGESAITLLDACGYDIVLLDCNMPGLNGAATLERIRGIDHGTRVIMISASRDEERVRTTLAAGAAAFLFKPFFAVDVDRALHVALGLKVPGLIANATPPFKPKRLRKAPELCPVEPGEVAQGSLWFVDEATAWLESLDGSDGLQR